MYRQKNVYCDVEFSWERKNKINVPYPSVFELTSPKEVTAKAVRMQVKRCQHSVTGGRVDREGNIGHCDGMTGWGGGGEKGQMIGPSL